jgi:hypothetical protein
LGSHPGEPAIHLVVGESSAPGFSQAAGRHSHSKMRKTEIAHGEQIRAKAARPRRGAKATEP